MEPVVFAIMFADPLPLLVITVLASCSGFGVGEDEEIVVMPPTIAVDFSGVVHPLF